MDQHAYFMWPVPYDRNRLHHSDGLCMEKRDFCPFHFTHWQQLTPPPLQKHQKKRDRGGVITNEPLRDFLGHSFP